MTFVRPYVWIVCGAAFAALCSGVDGVTPALGLTPLCAARARPADGAAHLHDHPLKLETLKRAPVMFRHATHTAALKEEGCEACHPKQAASSSFSFPKERDETRRDAFMDSFHNVCVACHTQRASEGKKTGPVTCGECHADEKGVPPQEYVPISPEYYDALRDTYHKECLACHQKPAKVARALDWKSFYVREKKKVEAAWPRSSMTIPSTTST